MSNDRKVPISLDERVLDRYFARDPKTGAPAPDEALDSLARALRTARSQAEQTIALADALDKDPTRTREAAAVSLRDSAVKVAERTGKLLDDARARVKASIQAIEAETAAPPPPREPHAVMLETEVRAALAKMDRKQREATIRQALASGDDVLLGAAFRGPAVLSGMTPEEQNAHRYSWRKARFPAEVDRIERLNKALGATERGGKAFISFLDKLSASPGALAAEQAARVSAQIQATINTEEAA